MTENSEPTPENERVSVPYLHYRHDIRKSNIVRSPYLVSESTRDASLKPKFCAGDEVYFYGELVASLKVTEFQQQVELESQTRLYPR